jgi:hypothetical protein
MNEKNRHYLYIAAAVLIAILIAVDVLRGGDAGEWVTWLAGLLGLGAAGLAAKNTSS